MAYMHPLKVISSWSPSPLCEPALQAYPHAMKISKSLQLLHNVWHKHCSTNFSLQCEGSWTSGLFGEQVCLPGLWFWCTSLASAEKNSETKCVVKFGWEYFTLFSPADCGSARTSQGNAHYSTWMHRRGVDREVVGRSGFSTTRTVKFCHCAPLGP